MSVVSGNFGSLSANRKTASRPRSRLRFKSWEPHRQPLTLTPDQKAKQPNILARSDRFKNSWNLEDISGTTIMKQNS
jgi:hypothetical protein